MIESKLQILIPVHNEEDCLPTLIARLEKIRNENRSIFEMFVLFVDDGSSDKSADIIKAHCLNTRHFQLLSLSRNFGHQIAITAGIDYANAEYFFIMDADLQDPPELINLFFEKILMGNDIVYAQRTKRMGETMFKKITALGFYSIFRKLSNIDIHDNAGDFYMFNQKVLQALRNMPEKHRFLRALLPWAGFRSALIEYERDERFAGKTKFPFRKMISFSIDAIFSFSTLPMRLATFSGLLIMLCGLFFGFFLMFQKISGVDVTDGLTTTLLAILFVGGLQVTMLGIVGEYIGRIYEEVKARPLYFVQQKTNF